MLGLRKPSECGPEGASPAVSFDGLVSQLTNKLKEAHAVELENLKKKYEGEAKEFRQQIDRLREEIRCLHAGEKYPIPIVADDKAADDSYTSELGIGPGDDLDAIDLDIEGTDFDLLTGWTKTLPADAGYTFERTMQLYNDKANPDGSKKGASGAPRKDAAGKLVMRKTWNQSFVIFPGCTFRLTWDVCGLVLISYDLMTIPFNQAFQPAPSTFSMACDWTTLIFWTGDMIQGFFLGYYSKGEVIMHNKKIIVNYLKTWFIVDAVVVIPEWTMMFLPSSEDGTDVGDLGRIAKFARVARVLRLLRLLKMKKLLETLVDRIESEYTFILSNLLFLMCFVLVLNHVIACLWYLIGRVTMGQGLTNWVDVGKVKGEKISYLYATSLHWSLTQFTPASMDISARNLWERLFSVMILLFAMLVFSSIVASITAAMTALRNLQGDQMRQFWLLRRFLRQRNIRKTLSGRIIKFLEHRSAVQGNLVQRERVPILSGLSEALQDELMHEMHSPELVAHAFFDTLNMIMPAVMHRLCRLAFNLQFYAVEDPTFHAGDEGKKMFFIKSGILDYLPIGCSEPLPMEPKDWLSEPVLFTTWRHRGSLQACTESELIAVDPKQFMTVMSVHPRPWHYAVSYAKAFIHMLNSRDDFSDVCKFEGMHEELMSAVCAAGGTDAICVTDPDTMEKSMVASGTPMVRDRPKNNSASVVQDEHALRDADEHVSPTSNEQCTARLTSRSSNGSSGETSRWWAPAGHMFIPCPQSWMSRLTGR